MLCKPFFVLISADLTFLLYLNSLNLQLYFVIMYNKLPKLEPEDFYLTKEGYKVFTETYHLKRGYCCESGCRHCPYGYDKKTNSQ